MTKGDGGRKARLERAIQMTLAELLRDEIKDPRVHAAGIATLTHVVLNRDLRVAKVYVSFHGDGSPDDAIAALERAAGWARAQVGAELGLKFAPEIRFVLDRSAEQVDRIDRILREDRER